MSAIARSLGRILAAVSKVGKFSKHIPKITKLTTIAKQLPKVVHKIKPLVSKLAPTVGRAAVSGATRISRRVIQSAAKRSVNSAAVRATIRRNRPL